MSTISDDGWLEFADRIESPNFDPRPYGTAIDLLVIHNISLPPGNFGSGYVQQFFCNQLDYSLHPYFQTLVDVKVSAHCLIEREGRVIQFVSFLDRAWHAGVSCFEGRERCNDFSVGIELEGTDDHEYTEQQYLTLAHVTQALTQAYPGINKNRIVGHSDIAPLRKTDPGPAFEWQKFIGMLS